MELQQKVKVQGVKKKHLQSTIGFVVKEFDRHPPLTSVWWHGNFKKVKENEALKGNKYATFLISRKLLKTHTQLNKLYMLGLDN